MANAETPKSRQNFALYPIALYVVLFSFLGLRLYTSCWQILFRLPVVRSSALRILWLYILLVIQALLIGTLIFDILIQQAEHDQEQSLPAIPMFLVGLICTVIEVVHASTQSFRAALSHTMLAHFPPFMASLILHLSQIPVYPMTHHTGVLWLYAAGLAAVFWNDIKLRALDCSRSVISFASSGVDEDAESSDGSLDSDFPGDVRQSQSDDYESSTTGDVAPRSSPRAMTRRSRTHEPSLSPDRTIVPGVNATPSRSTSLDDDVLWSLATSASDLSSSSSFSLD